MCAESIDLPVARAAVESHDLGEFQEIMTLRYVDHRPRVIGEPRDFMFRSQAATSGGLTVEHARYRGGMAISTEPFRSILVTTVQAGRFAVAAGQQRSQVTGGTSLLLPPWRELGLIMDQVTVRVVQFRAEAVGRVASRLGVDPLDFRFDAMTPVSPAANQLWATTVTYLTNVLAGPDVPPIMLNAAVEAAATAAVSVFPNTTMTVGYTPGAGQVAPAAVRRAVAYMEANAAEPITVEDIATASGIGVRALQAGFRRHLGVTPVAYLRRVRLDGAHRDLQAADAAGGATVADIAYRWGFPNLGRFAGYYRAAFGRRPSQTLQT